MSLTLVTAFYDLNKLEKRPNDKTKDNYLRWAEFLFKLDINLIFYVDSDIFFYIWKKRAAHKLLHKTLIVRKDFNELKFYNMRNELEQYKKEHPIVNSMPNKDSANYIILTWNKMFMVEEAMAMNPFNTTHFGWIDFGIYNVACNDMPKDVIKELIPTTKKIKILELRTVFQKETVNLYNYCKEFRWKTAGGLWFGGIDYLNKFLMLFKKQLFDILSLRIFAHEETIMALTFNKNQDLFDPFYGNYYQILCNINHIVCPQDLIFENMKNCRLNGDQTNALKIATKLYNDCYTKIESNRKYTILDEIVVNAYNINRPISNKFANILVTELETNKEMFECFLKDKDRLISNLEFFDNKDELLSRINNLLLPTNISIIIIVKECPKQQIESILQQIKPTDCILISDKNIDYPESDIISKIIINKSVTNDLLFSICLNFSSLYTCIIKNQFVLNNNYFNTILNEYVNDDFLIADDNIYFYKSEHTKNIIQSISSIENVFNDVLKLKVVSTQKEYVNELDDVLTNYKLSINYFLDKMVNHEPFTLIRYGDGEYFICNNMPYKSTIEDNWIFTPNGITTAQLLETTKLYNTNNYYGIHATCDVKKYKEYFYEIIKNDNITFATIFCNNNFPIFKNFIENSSLNIVLVASEYPENNKLVNNKIIDKYIINDKLIQKWHECHAEHLENIKKLAMTHYKEIFLISAGPLAKIFIYNMYKVNPNNMYVDVGSALDYFTKKTISRACYKEGHPDSLHNCYF